MDNRLFTMDDNPIEIIAGDTVEIPYEVLRRDGRRVNLTEVGTEIIWMLSPYGNLGTTVLEKSLIVSDSSDIDFSNISVGTKQSNSELGNLNYFNVKIMPQDTLGMSGLYTYQIVLKDSDGVVNRRMQGNILIWQNNNRKEDV